MAASVMNVGRFIADALVAAGVRIAYTVPGESFLPLLDGMAGAGIRVVAARHENGAGFMAVAHGALTGRPAVVLATRAVGAANVSVALHVAQADSVPLVALVGQVARASRGREAFQEAEVASTFGGLCRFAREIRDAASLPAALDEALRQATTARPGPVLLSLPADLLDEPASSLGGSIATASVLGPSRAAEPDRDAVRRILHLLLDARRPVILAGAGILRSRATADLVRLAELVEVPVVAAWRRPDAFPNDHPLYLGMSGYFAAPTVLPRLLEADAMLVLGCRLSEVTSHGWRVPAPGTRWAHVDIEPLAGRAARTAQTVALASDARTFVREARRVLGLGVLDASSLRARRANNAADRAAYEEARVVDRTPWEGPGVHPGRAIAVLGRLLPPDGVVTTDAGNFGGWAARGLALRRPGTYLGTTAGAMGFGLPAAIAASLAAPARPVVALVGDGGLGMSIAEVETAVREGARPVVLCFDNQQYGTIRDHQARRGLVPLATNLGAVDWASVAEGFGAIGVRIESDDEVEPALRAALVSRRPTVLHLLVDRRWVSVDHLADEPGVEEPAPTVTAVSVPAEPEPYAEPEPWVVVEPEPGLAPEVEAVPAIELVPEPGPDPALAPAIQPEPMPTPESWAEVEAVPVPEPAIEPGREPEPVPGEAAAEA